MRRDSTTYYNNLQELDISRSVPPAAKTVFLDYLIFPPEGKILVLRHVADMDPVSLRGPEGRVEIELANPARLYLKIFPSVAEHQIAVDGYRLGLEKTG